MTDDRIPAEQDAILDPEDVNSSPVSASPAETDTDRRDPSDRSDRSDEVPVPIAMSPAEVDERAQAVEAMGGARPADEEDARA